MSKISINKNVELPLDLCRYKVQIKFSAYDVLDGEELKVDFVYMNDELIKPLSEISEDEKTHGQLVIVEDSATGTLRYIHTVDLESLKYLKLRLEKVGYFPFEGTFSLNVTSIYDDVIEIDLGRVALLNEIKEDAIVLTWGTTPTDLDSYLVCPNNEVVGILQGSDDTAHIRDNYYAAVSVDDSSSEGPETLTINHWVNLDDKYKIGGKFRYYVNWYKD